VGKTRWRWNGVDHRILTFLSLAIVCACVTYMNQREQLVEYLGRAKTVAFDFVAAFVMLLNTQMERIFGRRRKTDEGSGGAA
jgi:hypothetical protein